MKQRLPAGFRWRAVVAVAVGCACLLPACKDGRTITSGFTIAEAVFAPDDPGAAADHFVSLDLSSSNVGTVFLDVVIHDVSQLVSGIALKMSYPAAFSRFIGCTDGQLFPPPSNPDYACFADEDPDNLGELILGRSSVPADFTEVTGGVAVLRMEFLVFGLGEGPIVFEGQNLGGGDASAVLDENGDPIFMQWFSGTLSGIDSGM